MINDENLVSELKKHNKDALAYLIKRYGNTLMKVSYSVLEDKETSMECVNDAFLRIWDNIDSFKGENGKFTTWIIVITKRIAIDEFRKNSKKNSNLPLEEAITKSSLDNIETQIEDKEFKDKILEEINSMEPINREIFLRRFFLDQAIKDIATSMNLTVSTISNRILRGKKKLGVLFREEVI